jgi:hypothetical protein
VDYFRVFIFSPNQIIDRSYVEEDKKMFVEEDQYFSVNHFLTHYYIKVWNSKISRIYDYDQVLDSLFHMEKKIKKLIILQKTKIINLETFYKSVKIITEDMKKIRNKYNILTFIKKSEKEKQLLLKSLIKLYKNIYWSDSYESELLKMNKYNFVYLSDDKLLGIGTTDVNMISYNINYDIGCNILGEALTIINEEIVNRRLM